MDCELTAWCTGQGPGAIPMEPALGRRDRGRGSAGESAIGLADAPWEDGDDEDDRVLRAAEVPLLSRRLNALLLGNDRQPDQAPGLFRAAVLLQERLEELGG